MKLHTVTKGVCETIIDTLPNGESGREFVVEKDAKLLLILTATDLTDAQATVHIRLAGRGASARIVGIVVGKDKSRVSLHTLQQHDAPETTSNLLVKTVLDDAATCMYDGGILVSREAQKTDAYQRNENLFLSSEAHAESKPALEILANDVRCTHGATAGPISNEQLWYLQTRGVSVRTGRRLIVEGFLHSALEVVEDAGVQAALLQQLMRSI